MQMPIKNLLERNAFLIAITLTILVAVTSLISISNSGIGSIIKVKNSDKIAHFIAYFVLSSAWYFAVKFDKKSLAKKITIILSLILYGIVIEVLQDRLTTYRTGDFYDVIANSTGILLASILFKRLNSWFNYITK